MNVALPGTNQNYYYASDGDYYYYDRRVAPNGDLYQLTSSPTTTPGVSTYYLTAIDPDDPAHFRTISLGQLRYASLPGYTYDYYSNNSYYFDSYSHYDLVDQAFAPDGTVYVDVTPVNGPYGVMSVDRTLSIRSNPVSVPGDYAYQRVVGPDGTSYQLSYTYDYVQGYYSVNAVTVIDPDDPTHATSISLPGSFQSGVVTVAEDGTAYLYLGYEYVSGVGYRSKVMVFDPSDPYHPTVVEVPGYINRYDIVPNDDGSAFVSTNNFSGGTTTLTRIDTADTFQP